MIQVIHTMIYIPKIIKQSRFSIYIAILHGLLICNICVESEWISVHEGAARALEYFTQSTSAPVSKCHAYSVRLQYTTTSPVYLM